MKPEELHKELKNDVVRPLYCLYGEDDFLKDESFSRLKELSLKGGMVDFNYDLFHCGDVEMSRVISAAMTLPVMAKRRFVILKGIDRLRADDLEQLLTYVDDPSPSTTLVMVGKAVDKRKKVFLRIDKAGGLVEHKHPYERDMPKWIRWIAKKIDMDVSDEAARYLVDIIGTDLGSVKNELEKAALYAGDRKRIDAGDIEAVSVDVKARTVFQLIDALGTKNLKKSIKNLKKLTEAGESPILILSLIVRQLRLIWTGVDIMKRGGSEGDVKKSVKLPPFVFKDYMKQLKLFGEEELKDAYDRLAELDLKFKSSPIDKEKALELLLFQLCGAGPAAK